METISSEERNEIIISFLFLSFWECSGWCKKFDFNVDISLLLHAHSISKWK